VNINKIDIESLIRDRLEETRNCKFKEAWIPMGWACVPIQSFSGHLAEEIYKFITKEEKEDGLES